MTERLSIEQLRCIKGFESVSEAEAELILDDALVMAKLVIDLNKD